MHLEAITEDNRDQALKLQVRNDQKNYIETVKQCLEESDELSLWKPMGIYDENQMIGFAMYGLWFENNQERVWLDRFLIDQKFQGMGFGKKALNYLIWQIFFEFHCDKIYLSLYEDNKVAAHLYEEFGFVYNGEYDIHNEAVMVLQL